MAEEIDISPFRNPCAHLCLVDLPNPRRRDGSHDHLASEIILIGRLVGLRRFRMLIIHRHDHRLSRLTRPVVHGIKVRHQTVAQAQEFPHHSLRLLLKAPRFFSIKFTAGTVKPHNRRKYAELRPPRLHLVVLIAPHVASDIMTPPAIADIGSVGRKIRLEIEGFPCGDGIARKSYRIPVASRTRIPGKCHRAFSLPLTVQKMVVIQHPKRIQSRNFAVIPLLPVHPPEIHAHFLIRMVRILKISLQKSRIRNIKVNRIFLFPVHAQRSGHIRIHFLKAPDAFRRMDIQSRPHPAFMKRLKKTLRIGKQAAIPRIPGPSAAVFRIDIHQMPVHIDDSHRKWDIFTLEPVH